MKRIFVVAAMLLRNEQLLLARRGPAQSMPGQWEFPGGKVEAGEEPEAALARELLEELALRIGPPVFFAEVIHCYPAFELRLRAYLVREWEGEPVLHEHAALAWVPPAELLSYELTAADVPLARKLITFRENPST